MCSKNHISLLNNCFVFKMPRRIGNKKSPGGSIGSWSEHEDLDLFTFVMWKSDQLDYGQSLTGLGGYTFWEQLEENGFSRNAGACRTHWYQLKKTLPTHYLTMAIEKYVI